VLLGGGVGAEPPEEVLADGGQARVSLGHFGLLNAKSSEHQPVAGHEYQRVGKTSYIFFGWKDILGPMLWEEGYPTAHSSGVVSVTSMQ
jgi:hypothetical protein